MSLGSPTEDRNSGIDAVWLNCHKYKNGCTINVFRSILSLIMEHFCLRVLFTLCVTDAEIVIFTSAMLVYTNDNN